MSAATPPPDAPEPEAAGPGTAVRLAVAHRAGGVVAPLLTVVLAFLAGGVVVVATTGKNPISTYRAIFDGTGLNWLFPWISSAERTTASYNLQSTLILTTTLMLTGLAVAFAFRCGLFNIGGQGQYIVGSLIAVWVGSSLAGMSGIPHVLLAIVLATLAGAAYAGIAGLLKALLGAHEVIVTIMLNWTAFWVGGYLLGIGGPLHASAQADVPVSNDVVANSRLHVWWGDALLQGLHIGFFIAIAALVAFWIVLNRTTLGYEVRAVGFNPDAASYGGISVARSYFLAMAISGLFAGLAGAIDVLGWEYRLQVNDIQTTQVGFIGIAVALLGRNTAIGVALSALLFGALLNGTSTRSLDPSVFKPELAANLTLLIQGLVVLFVGADVLVLYLLRTGKKLRFGRRREGGG